jgi:two-component system sensor histidine kinase FlrB
MAEQTVLTVAPAAGREADAGHGDGALNVLPVGVVVLDASGRITDANDAAAEFFGEPLWGLAWSTVLERHCGALPGDSAEQTLADGRSLRIARREIPGGGCILLITETTRRRKLEEALSRHRRLATMGEMAATLAHQIRTPLSAALLYATNAANGALPGERRQELLGKAVDCLHDLEFLVADMLRFAGGAQDSHEATFLDEVLAGVERAATALIRPGQELRVGTVHPGLRLAGNRETLCGALLNLVSNAFQAAGPAARVTVTAEMSGGPDSHTVSIAVTDNGPGVPTALRRRIFDPFYTTRANGTGLGLAVVRSVAEAAGGQVRVEDAPGGGARFVMTLPLATEPGVLPPAGFRPAAARTHIVAA